MNDYKTDQLSNLDIRVDNEVKTKFAEAAKWSKFISILIFIFAGIMLLVGVLGSAFIIEMFSKINQGFSPYGDIGTGLVITIVILVVALLSVNYFFLYKFATKIKLAISTEDQGAMTEALHALKIFFIISSVVSALSILNSFKDFF